MKKILTILFLVLKLLAIGQDIPPANSNFKKLQSPSFNYYTITHRPWMYMGSMYGWRELASWSQMTDTLDYYKLKSDSLAPYGYTRRDRLASELAKKENTLTKGNLTAGSTKISVTGGNSAIIGSGTSIDVNEGNLTLSNIGGSVTDTQVPNTITLDNITQVTNRSHTNLTDIGTNTHTQIDNHISSTSNPHSVTANQVGLGNVTNDAQVKRSEMGAANGVATLLANGKLPSSQVPSIAISETFPITNESDKVLLSSAEKGDIAIVSSTSKSYILKDDPYSVESNWVYLRTPESPIQSVNGMVGSIQINPSLSGNTLSLTGGTSTVNIGSATDVAANTAARHSAVTLGTANGLSLSGQQLSLGLASTNSTGALSFTDWNTFNSKQSAYTNLTSIGSLTNGSGFLKNNGSGTFSYTFPAFSEIISKPTTLAGYGITDAVQLSPAFAQLGNVLIDGLIQGTTIQSLGAVIARNGLSQLYPSSSYLDNLGNVARILSTGTATENGEIKLVIANQNATSYVEALNISNNGAATFASTVSATQLQSTIATGTAPLTVNSTTMVSNLNAEFSKYTNRLKALSSIGGNVNTDLIDGGVISYYGTGGWTNAPTDFNYGSIYQLNGSRSDGYLHTQLAFDVYNRFYFRQSIVGGYSDWVKIWHSGNLQNPITGTLTSGYIPVATGSGSLGNSIISQSGTTAIINSTITAFTEIDQLKLETGLYGYDFRISNYNNAGGVQYRFIQTNGGTKYTPLIFDTGNIIASSLSGTGTRIVTASSTGQLGVVSGTGLVKSDGSVDINTYLTGITSSQVTSALGYTPYNSTNPNNYIPLTAISSTATGLTYTNTTGVLSLASGYAIPTTSNISTWNALVSSQWTTDTNGITYANNIGVGTESNSTVKFVSEGSRAAWFNSTSASGYALYGKTTGTGADDWIAIFGNTNGITHHIYATGDVDHSGGITLGLFKGTPTTGSIQNNAGSIQVYNGSGWVAIGGGSGSMTWPTNAGLAYYNGSGWGTSYGTSGSGTTVALTTSPSFTTPNLGVATATTINSMFLNKDTRGNQTLGTTISTITTGLYNMAIGIDALKVVTSGQSNVAIGIQSLRLNQDGSYNTAIGVDAMYANTSGEYNTVIGKGGLQGNTIGNYNIAIGDNAGSRIDDTTLNTSSSNSIFIGIDSRPKQASQSNEIIIGNSTYGNGSNTVTIGGASSTTTYLTPVIVLRSSSSAPTGVEGGVYYNSSTKHFYGYDGTNWKQLDN